MQHYSTLASSIRMMDETGMLFHRQLLPVAMRGASNGYMVSKVGPTAHPQSYENRHP
ncbi:MAG: hypothetical protein ACLSFV_20910 [Bacteroides xylanisolvens]